MARSWKSLASTTASQVILLIVTGSCEREEQSCLQGQDCRYAFFTNLDSTHVLPAASHLVLASERAGAEVQSLESSLAMPAPAFGAAWVGSSDIYIANGDWNAIAKVSYSADTFKVGTRVTFGEGTRISGSSEISQLAVASNQSGFYFDGWSARVLRWNPSQMTAKEPIALELLKGRDGWRFSFTETPLQLHGKLYATGSWQLHDRAFRATAVVVIDIASEQASVFVDERCSAASMALRADGWLYLATVLSRPPPIRSTRASAQSRAYCVLTRRRCGSTRASV